MPDEKFDAVIIGGGTKALFLAMYLMKYGGMTVGVFERRHEIGGCLATEEMMAPGFRSNTRANIILPWYYVPVWRDFPDFWEYGGQIDQYLCSTGSIFLNNQTCITMLLSTTHYHQALEDWESREMQYCLLRFVLSAAVDTNEPGGASDIMGMVATLPTTSFAGGGTHQIAHAAHQILVQMGCRFFTHSEVETVFIENVTATGITLKDRSRIGARKLVVSTLNPMQLCFDLIGREHLDPRIIRRIELLEHTFGCLMWYSSYAPEGKHIAHTEQLAPPATHCSEREWLDIKMQYAESLISTWQKFAHKIIATDLGLGKPWEEQGKEDPDSLVEQLWAIRKRVRMGMPQRV